jgi:hypothetical protein
LKKLLFITGGGLLATLLIAVLILASRPATGAEALPTAYTTPSPAPATQAPVPPAAASPREQILAQMRRQIDEYDQAVQFEKQNGAVEISKDPGAGEEIFRFSGSSAEKILKRYDELNQKLQALNRQYVAAYKSEVQPTPFPTQQTEPVKSTGEENKAYYDLLLEQYQVVYNQELANGETLMVYNPDEGRYRAMLVGDAYARIEITTQAFEELRIAPLLAKVNQDVDMALIRRVTGKPDLSLTLTDIQSLANAPWIETSIYLDQFGVKYRISLEAGRLAQIEPAGRKDIPASEAKSADELRAIAEQFALANSLRLAELKSVLSYDEGGKGNLRFFRWDYRKDWSGTDWVFMPPFLQVGVAVNGKIVTYINTLDLVEFALSPE